MKNFQLCRLSPIPATPFVQTHLAQLWKTTKPQDDEDSYTETEPNLDDEQELSALAQRQPSTFHTAMSREVHIVIFFFSCLKLISTSIEAILARIGTPNDGPSGGE